MTDNRNINILYPLSIVDFIIFFVILILYNQTLPSKSKSISSNTLGKKKRVQTKFRHC